MTINTKDYKTEHLIAGLNLESDSMHVVISRFGKPNSRIEAPGDFSPNDTAVSHSEWIFDTYNMFVASWWFPKTKEREWILGVRLEGEKCQRYIHTGAGITLGSTYQQVVNAYGQPNWDGEFGFLFQDGYSLRIGFTSNKLVNLIQLMVPMGPN